MKGKGCVGTVKRIEGLWILAAETLRTFFPSLFKKRKK